jgi:hypothetical protein
MAPWRARARRLSESIATAGRGPELLQVGNDVRQGGRRPGRQPGHQFRVQHEGFSQERPGQGPGLVALGQEGAGREDSERQPLGYLREEPGLPRSRPPGDEHDPGLLRRQRGEHRVDLAIPANKGQLDRRRNGT